MDNTNKYIFYEDVKKRWLGKLNTQTNEFFRLVPWHDRTPSIGWCISVFDPDCYIKLSKDESKRKLRDEILYSVGYSNNTLTEQRMMELVEMLAEGEYYLYVLE